MHPLPQPTNPDYKPSHKLHGKVALVTGGDSGIGRAVCFHFALEGATVAFTYVKGVEDRDKDDTLHMIQSAKLTTAKEPITIPSDLGFDENCKKVIDHVVQQFGKIDILVNNAAEQHLSNIEDITVARLERVFRTNIFSHFYLTRHALKHMKEGRSIINSTSVNAYSGVQEKGAVVNKKLTFNWHSK
ncbi:glucose and ribitol dehydrogenase-like [Euphorbia lathyris]|uniref:glucose and ribitol dehydrogenase-like n=1 Tax=Euphorbia lathyris TaxID=212925 RepID=UPI003313FE9D